MLQNRIRPHITFTTWPRPALILTDTPAPDCADCHGDGGWAYDYGDETGYAGTNWTTCPCWDAGYRRTLLRLPRPPRWLRRRTGHPDPWAPGGYSNKPPF